MCEPQTAIQRTWQLVHDAYQRGYSQGVQDGLEQGTTHPAIVASVQRMFGDWQGAEKARQQSAERFRNEYRNHQGGDE